MSSIAIITGISFLLSLVFVRVLITLLPKWGLRQVIREEMPDSHQVKAKTPMMGGVGFFLATIIVVAGSGGLANPKVKAVLLIATMSFLIGLVDDLAKFLGKNTKGFSARYKLVIQIVLGALLGYFMIWQSMETEAEMALSLSPSLIHAPFVGGIELGKLLIPFVIFVYVGTLNSVNFTDGVDGLLGGCFLVVSGAFVILISRLGDTAMVPLLFTVCGAVAAFLWFNSNPAKIFMGDSGSLFLGGLLASVAVVTRTEIFLAIAGLLFVAEMMSVIIQVASFKLTGKRVFRMAPIHHHFELAGWSETQVSQRFWILSALFSGIGLMMFLP